MSDHALAGVLSVTFQSIHLSRAYNFTQNHNAAKNFKFIGDLMQDTYNLYCHSFNETRVQIQKEPDVAE